MVTTLSDGCAVAELDETLSPAPNTVECWAKVVTDTAAEMEGAELTMIVAGAEERAED